MNYPTYVKNCIRALESAGFSAYAVGGAVRDSLLGAEPADWDVTTSATPDEILSVFADHRTIPTGIKHGTVTVLFGDDARAIPVEITTFRIDGEYRDSRHPESVSFSRNLRDDLSRRDFTVNAMAFNECEGVIDLFGGQDDLEKEIIRAVGEPQKRFSEDALRILRAFRFSAQLSFEIDKKTLEGAYMCSHLLSNIARERIGVEFKKLLASFGTVYSLTKMIEGGIWNKIFDLPAPDIELVKSLEELDERHFAPRLSVLISYLSEKEREELLGSLRLSNDEKKSASDVASASKEDFAISENEDISVFARRFLHYCGDIFEFSFDVFCFWHKDTDEIQKYILKEFLENRPLTVSSLAVKGSDILPLCEGDYKRVGQTLKFLLERVIEDPNLNNKEKLIEIAKKSLA